MFLLNITVYLLKGNNCEKSCYSFLVHGSWTTLDSDIPWLLSLYHLSLCTLKNKQTLWCDWDSVRQKELEGQYLGAWMLTFIAWASWVSFNLCQRCRFLQDVNCVLLLFFSLFFLSVTIHQHQLTVILCPLHCFC